MHRDPIEGANHNDGAPSRNAKSDFPSENATKQKSHRDFGFRRNGSPAYIEHWRVRVAVAAITFLAIVPGPAQAQSTTGPTPAPIGHRQPRAQDLPPDVLRDEGMTRPPMSHQPQGANLPSDEPHDAGKARSGRSILDKELQICRGC
jgi:hypothetical protein